MCVYIISGFGNVVELRINTKGGSGSKIPVSATVVDLFIK